LFGKGIHLERNVTIAEPIENTPMEKHAVSRITLSSLDWTLSCWRPYAWRLGKSREIGFPIKPDLETISAKVPGSAQQALLDAEKIPDWTVGMNSLACEWIEHRHWDFSATLPADSLEPGEQIFLCAEGLDYSGWILVDSKEVGEFSGALITHRFDLTDALSEDKPHELSIVFDQAPQEQGQIGYTSRSQHFKPRFSYSWDWTPRVVPVGVWDTLSLLSGTQCAINATKTTTTLAEDNQTGQLVVELQLDTALASPEEVGDVRVALGNKDCCQFISATGVFASDTLRFDIGNIPVEAWWPNGLGKPKTYTLTISAEVRGQAWSEERTIGFKRVHWLPCEGAAPDAEPWICEINGEAIFLQGANWTPPRTCYHDSTDDEYRKLIALYRDMGANLLRVWGGAILEKEIFYRLCDEAGILVWQEFPLSSSGVENWPPEDTDAIDALRGFCKSYIRRRSHHPSLLIWCGGNELTDGGSRGGVDTPCDNSHPCLSAMKTAVEQEDPTHRFLPTSPSGPLFFGQADQYGTGLLHDVHGPWGFSDEWANTMEEWREYWRGDDALFRSETGMPGPQALEPMLKYAGDNALSKLWPPTSEYWRHTSAWWAQWQRFKETLAGLPADKVLAKYIELAQQKQAEAYGIAAESCKRRFPKCGGFIVWMGHDSFPCPSNNSFIDYDRNPKPAYFALKKVFEAEA
jgi:beta-mannosidase